MLISNLFISIKVPFYLLFSGDPVIYLNNIVTTNRVTISEKDDISVPNRRRSIHELMKRDLADARRKKHLIDRHDRRVPARRV